MKPCTLEIRFNVFNFVPDGARGVISFQLAGGEPNRATGATALGITVWWVKVGLDVYYVCWCIVPEYYMCCVVVLCDGFDQALGRFGWLFTIEAQLSTQGIKEGCPGVFLTFDLRGYKEAHAERCLLWKVTWLSGSIFFNVDVKA